MVWKGALVESLGAVAISKSCFFWREDFRGNCTAFFFLSCCSTRMSSILCCGLLGVGADTLASFYGATAKMSDICSKSDLAVFSHI